MINTEQTPAGLMPNLTGLARSHDSFVRYARAGGRVMLHLVHPTKGDDPNAHALAIAGSAEDELLRLAAVTRYEILDSAPEAAFDGITAMAADLFSAPISIISFVGLNRVYFKSHHGLGETEINRGPGASTFALAPWIRAGFKHGFHVGVPLRAPDGHELGKLSVMDRRPRQVDEKQMRCLKSLAVMVMDRLELRWSAREAAEQAQAMRREVEHRALNSLQFVASLLRLQSRAAGSPDTSRQLTVAANRVLAVAGVHRAFSSDETAGRVPVLAYLRQLCSEFSEILGADIRVDGVEASVPKGHIMSIGLVVNELVTNARKHGAGQITVTLRSGPDGQQALCVLDEGQRLPPGFAADRPHRNGIGMKVVTALMAQLQGRISAQTNPPGHPAGAGTCFMMTFPAS